MLALLRLGTYCADVDTLGADAALAQMQLATAAGVLYLDDGWSQLTDALSAGVDVRATSEVRSIEPAAGRFELVCDAGRVVARQVVVAVGTPAAARQLLPEPPDWGDLGPPVTAACLDLGVTRPPDPGYVLGIDAPLYATTQGPPARQSPPGGAVVAVLRYGARSAAEDRPELDAHRRLAGVADDAVVVERFLASMTVASTAPRADRGGCRAVPDPARRALPVSTWPETGWAPPGCWPMRHSPAVPRPDVGRCVRSTARTPHGEHVRAADGRPLHRGASAAGRAGLSHTREPQRRRGRGVRGLVPLGARRPDVASNVPRRGSPPSPPGPLSTTCGPAGDGRSATRDPGCPNRWSAGRGPRSPPNWPTP